MPIRNDKILLNNPPSDWRISIGSTNVTQLVVRLELSKPIPSQRSPQLISGTIELVQPINFSQGRRSGVYAPGLENYSIDPAANSDFLAYAQPIEIFGEGRTIAILRFIEDAHYDFNTGVTTGNLGHLLLSVVDQESNQVDTVDSGGVVNVYDLTGNLSTQILPAGVYAQRLLASAKNGDGSSPFSESDLDISQIPTTLNNTFTATGQPETLGYEADQNFDGDLDAIIHGIFFENASCALEPIPGTERLRASERYPLSQGSRTPRLVLPWSQTIITPEQISIESPIDSIKVSAGGGGSVRRLRVVSSEYPYETVTARFADGSPAETTFIDQPVDSTDEVVTTFRRRTAIAWLIGSGGSGEITRTEVKTEKYGNQGEPLSREQRFTITRHELGKLPVPGLGKYQQDEKDVGDTSLTSGLRIDTEWEYDSAGNQTAITTTYRLGRQYVFEGAAGDGLTIALVETRVYQNTLNSTINPKWETFITRLIPRGLEEETEETTLIADPNFYSEHQPIDGVPRPEYRTPTSPITIQRFAPSQAGLSTASGSTSQQTVQSIYAASPEGSAQLAQTLLAMNAQLREVWDVRMPMPSGFDLFGSWDVYHIDNGYEARAIALVGPFLIYENNGEVRTLIYGGTAAQFGPLSTRILPIARPVSPDRYIAPTPVNPTPDIPLSINSISSPIIWVEGVDITPLELEAYGGMPPYSFSETGLPAGLSIVGSQIVGAPTGTSAAALVFITVEDALLASSQTQFEAEVSAVQLPVPSYSFPATGSAQVTGEITGSTLTPNEIDGVIEVEGELIGDSIAAFADGAIESDAQIAGQTIAAAAQGSIEAEVEILGEAIPAFSEGVIEAEGEIVGSTQELLDFSGLSGLPASAQGLVEIAANTVNPADPQSVIDAVSSFQHWFSASISDSLTLSGSNVTQWDNLIGGDNAAAVTADAIYTAVGGPAYVDFETNTAVLGTTTSLNLQGTTAKTMLVVAKVPNDRTTTPGEGFIRIEGGVGGRISFTSEISMRVNGSFIGFNQSIVDSFAAALTQIPANSTTADFVAWKDGSSLGQAGGTNLAQSINTATAPAEFRVGHIGEILTADSIIPAATLNTVMQFLNELGGYGITLQTIS